jgi:hypothetical protein
MFRGFREVAVQALGKIRLVAAMFSWKMKKRSSTCVRIALGTKFLPTGFAPVVSAGNAILTNFR